jgi:LacI family transcriptional regulator
MTRSDSGRRPARRPTLATIAEHAGVSRATVSKVINGRADVAAETRERVRGVLAEYDYAPRQRASAAIDLVFSSLTSPWAVEILRGVEAYASGHGRAVSVSTVGPHGAAQPPGWTSAVAQHQSAGVLLAMSQLTRSQWQHLRDRGIPLVAIDPADIPDPEVPSVGATNWAGGIAAAEHLLGLGHERIAVIGGPEAYLCSRARVEGFRHALERAERHLDPALLRWGDFSHEGGFRCALELLDRADRPTAIFAGNDRQALGVYEAARQLGLAIPEQLSVVGFDDLPLARWVSPPLTTVRQPLVEIGATAAELLLQLIDGRSLRSNRIELATELVARVSTAPRSQA